MFVSKRFYIFINSVLLVLLPLFNSKSAKFHIAAITNIENVFDVISIDNRSWFRHAHVDETFSVRIIVI